MTLRISCDPQKKSKDKKDEDKKEGEEDKKEDAEEKKDEDEEASGDGNVSELLVSLSQSFALISLSFLCFVNEKLYSRVDMPDPRTFKF